MGSDIPPWHLTYHDEFNQDSSVNASLWNGGPDGYRCHTPCTTGCGWTSSCIQDCLGYAGGPQGNECRQVTMDQLKSRLLSAYVRAREGQKGQGFVEYMMIIGLVALGLAAALIAFRNQLSNALSSVGAGV